MSDTGSTADELLKLAELRNQGVLTEEEFVKTKQRLLGVMDQEPRQVRSTDVQTKEPASTEDVTESPPATATTVSSSPASTTSTPRRIPRKGALAAAVVGFFLTFGGGALPGLGFLLVWVGIGLGLKGSRVVRWGGALILALLLYIPAASVHLSRAPSTPSNGAPTGLKAVQTQDVRSDGSETLEWKLATIQAGRPIPKNDGMVMRFAAVLDSLESKTVNSREDISDIIVRAWEILRRDVEPREDLYGTARALEQSIPNDAASLRLKLEDVAALYVTLRKSKR